MRRVSDPRGVGASRLRLRLGGGGAGVARVRTGTGGSLVEPSVGGEARRGTAEPPGGGISRAGAVCLSERGAFFFFFFCALLVCWGAPVVRRGGGVVSRRAYRVKLVPGGDGEDITVGVEREARDRLAEVEAHEALRGLGAPQANLVVQRSAREHVRVRRVEPHDPRRASVPRERPQTRARAAVDELDRVVAVRGRDELPVGAERRRDRRPRRGSQLAVRRRAPRERVPLGPRAKRRLGRARERGGTARRTPGRRREPAARAEPTARVELARANALEHRGRERAVGRAASPRRMTPERREGPPVNSYMGARVSFFSSPPRP
jgi:hypothetical protein